METETEAKTNKDRAEENRKERKKSRNHTDIMQWHKKEQYQQIHAMDLYSLIDMHS